MRSYYPSLGHAADLVKEGTLGDGAVAFVEAHVAPTMPRDLEALPGMVVGVPRFPSVEASGPAGAGVFSGNTNTFTSNWMAIDAGAAAPDRDALSFDDASAVKLVSRVYNNRLEARHIGRSVLSPDWMPVLRNFVRVNELASGTVKLAGANIFYDKPWPVSRESAALLRQAAKAFEVEERHIPFNYSDLASYEARAVVGLAGVERERRPPSSYSKSVRHRREHSALQWQHVGPVPTCTAFD